LIADTRGEDVEITHGARVIEHGKSAGAVMRAAVDLGVEALQGLIEDSRTVGCTACAEPCAPAYLMPPIGGSGKTVEAGETYFGTIDETENDDLCEG
jgi:hypothetical protein